MYQELQNANKKLVLKSEINNGNVSDKTQDTYIKKEAVKTGDDTIVGVFVFLGIGSLVSCLALRKRY